MKEPVMPVIARPSRTGWPLRSTVALGTTGESVSRARHHTTATLRAWNLAPLADTAELIVSELITNALQASWSCALVLPVMMRLRADGDSALIEVWDAAAAPPVPRSHAQDAIGGRGLEIVAALSSAWGYHMENGGKVVWALLCAGE
jgi:anti-sigma regulatory factor (Ser/Thr protein kinase)